MGDEIMVRPELIRLDPASRERVLRQIAAKGGYCGSCRATDFDVGDALYLGFCSSTRIQTRTWWPSRVVIPNAPCRERESCCGTRTFSHAPQTPMRRTSVAREARAGKPEPFDEAGQLVQFVTQRLKLRGIGLGQQTQCTVVR